MFLKRFKSGLIFPVVILFSLPVIAQVKFSTIVDPPVIGKHQLVQVEYVIENGKAIDNFYAPDFKNFTIIQGPLHSSGMNVVNGNVQDYKALIFILRPNIPGKLKIGGAIAMIDGKLMHSNTINIEV